MMALSVFMRNKKVNKSEKMEFAVDEQLTEERAIEIENLFEDFREGFTSAKCVEEEMDRETEMLASALVNIEKYIMADRQKQLESKLELRQVVKKFINFLQYGVNSSGNKSTIITLLKVLSKIIEKGEDKEELQTLFNKLGATRMVLMVLSESCSQMDNEMFRSFLIFINVMLDEGNRKVQRTIYEFFTSYQKSEVIFQRFN